jgi:hypothetical protein
MSRGKKPPLNGAGMWWPDSPRLVHFLLAGKVRQVLLDPRDPAFENVVLWEAAAARVRGRKRGPGCTRLD